MRGRSRRERASAVRTPERLRARAPRSIRAARRPSRATRARRDPARARASTRRSSTGVRRRPRLRTRRGSDTRPARSGRGAREPGEYLGQPVVELHGAASIVRRTIRLDVARTAGLPSPHAISELSWGQTCRCGTRAGCTRPRPRPSCARPTPTRAGRTSAATATCATRSAGTIPLHSRWPMFDATASIGRLSRSSPSAYYPLLEPERLVEALAQLGGLALEPRRQSRRRPTRGARARRSRSFAS